MAREDFLGRFARSRKVFRRLPQLRRVEYEVTSGLLNEPEAQVTQVEVALRIALANS